MQQFPNIKKIDDVEVTTAVDTSIIIDNIVDAKKRHISPIYNCPAWREGMPIAIVGGTPSTVNGCAPRMPAPMREESRMPWARSAFRSLFDPLLAVCRDEMASIAAFESELLAYAILSSGSGRSCLRCGPDECTDCRQHNAVRG